MIHKQYIDSQDTMNALRERDLGEREDPIPSSERKRSDTEPSRKRRETAASDDSRATKYQYTAKEIAEVHRHYNNLFWFTNTVFFGAGNLTSADETCEVRKSKVLYIIPYIHAVIVIVGWIVILCFVERYHIQQEMHDLVIAFGVTSCCLTLYNLHFGVQFLVHGDIQQVVHSVSAYPRKYVRILRSGITMMAFLIATSGAIFVLFIVDYMLLYPTFIGFLQSLGVAFIITSYFVTNLHLSTLYTWLLYSRATILKVQMKEAEEEEDKGGGADMEYLLKRKDIVITYMDEACATSSFWAIFHNIRIIAGMVVVSFFVSEFIIYLKQPEGIARDIAIAIAIIMFISLFFTLFSCVVAAGWFNEWFYELMADENLQNERRSDNRVTSALRDFYGTIMDCNEILGYRLFLTFMTLDWAVVLGSFTMVAIQYSVALRRGNLEDYFTREADGD